MLDLCLSRIRGEQYSEAGAATFNLHRVNVCNLWLTFSICCQVTYVIPQFISLHHFLGFLHTIKLFYLAFKICFYPFQISFLITFIQTLPFHLLSGVCYIFSPTCCKFGLRTLPFYLGLLALVLLPFLVNQSPDLLIFSFCCRFIYSAWFLWRLVWRDIVLRIGMSTMRCQSVISYFWYGLT